MPNNVQAADLVPTAEAAQIHGVDVSTIARWVRSGRLTPAMKIPGKRGAYLFHREDVEALRVA